MRHRQVEAVKWIKSLIKKLQCKLGLNHDLVEVPALYPKSEEFAVALYEVRAEWDEELQKIRVFMPTCTMCGAKVAGFEIRIRKWTVRAYAS